jgi:hypothetical protein
MSVVIRAAVLGRIVWAVTRPKYEDFDGVSGARKISRGPVAPDTGTAA